MDTIEKNDKMIETLTELLDPDEIILDPERRDFYSTDVYSRGALPSVVVVPENKEKVSKALAAAKKQGYVIVPRGGGMSYTGGYRAVREDTITFDMSRMNKILEINH